MRQYAVCGDAALGERWLAWASYPWTGRFLSISDDDSVTNHGFLNRSLNYDGTSTYNRKVPETGELALRSEQVLDNDYKSDYTTVKIFNDSETNVFEPQEKSILDILYIKNDDGTYTDPITNLTYQSTDTVSNNGFMIDKVKGIHRKD